jgi:putative TPR repeat protein
MKPKSLYRAALLEYLYCASFTVDPAEARAAYRSYRQFAKKDCPDGWLGLGRARQYGYGAKPNRAKAEKYYRRAAKLGHAEAQEALSAAYTNLPKSPTIGAPANGTPALPPNAAATPPMPPTASVIYMKKVSAAKKKFKQPIGSTAAPPKTGTPMPNAPSATCTKKASACHKTMPKPVNGTPAPPCRPMPPPATT